MLRNKLYYQIKPLLPVSARLAVRRWFALQKREEVRSIWPILPGSGQRPEGWPGWPQGKQFALVLTHDVEGPAGLAKCRQLMALEQKLGFRSAFNFIPEGGTYTPSQNLRDELVGNGFEVGVHDLYHDGKLFLSEKEFRRNAVRINHYLKAWGAVGFRSGFMLHNLAWAHDLNIQYDSSTFDTDPFEPQPEGVHTIFPFWVPRPNVLAPQSAAQRAATVVANGKAQANGQLGRNGQSAGSSQPATRSAQAGYVELPYTLPQDSTLFFLLAERHPDVWIQKLDWIAKHGGMVLIDTHPDYMTMPEGSAKGWEYPVSHYERFLDYVRTRYAGAYWEALPREVAQFVRNSPALVGARLEGAERSRGAESIHPRVAASVALEGTLNGNDAPALPPQARALNRRVSSSKAAKPKLWIDLDNTPHVPFFEPILEELRARGFPVLVTARDAFQVCDLADKKQLRYIKVGRHHGKNRLLKATGLAYRSFQLAPVVLPEKPVLGVSHGARSQILLSNLLQIPTLLIEDYEHCQFPPMMRPHWVLAPDVIPDEVLPLAKSRVRKYSGIKEDVYAWKLKPDPRLLPELGLSASDLIITVRPPATEAHYHNPESEKLFEALMNRACDTPHVKVVLLPRNKRQVELIRQRWPRWFEQGKTAVPKSAIDGMNLIWHSDLVVSGGGTMNREAAALGVPVYSIFRGTIGAVDKNLQAQGRLVLVESVADVQHKIQLVRRPRRSVAEVTSKATLTQIVDTIEELAERASA